MSSVSDDILRNNKTYCTETNEWSKWTTNIQIILYCLFVIVITIYCGINEKAWKDKQSTKSKLMLFLQTIWNKKSCYFPLILHIIDQSSDLGVIVQFLYLSKKELSSEINCIGLSMNQLFIASIIAFFAYRIISSIIIGFSTRSFCKGMSQFFDLEIFRALWINWKLKNETACNPQRWIQGLEAAFEASIQALIQIYYLIKTDSISTFNLILISTILSLWSISSKLISDDKIMIKNYAQYFLKSADRKKPEIENPFVTAPKYKRYSKLKQFIEGHRWRLNYDYVYSKSKCCKCIWILCCPFWIIPFILITIGCVIMLLFAFIIDAVFCNLKGIKKINGDYLIRVLFRIQDITLKIFLYVIIWIIISGYFIIALMIIDFIIILYNAYKLRQFDILFGVVTVVISKTNAKTWRFSRFWTIYRICWNMVMCVVIIIFVFTAQIKTTYFDSFIKNNVFSIFIVYYCLISSFITFPILIYYVFNSLLVDHASSSRDILDMILINDIQSIDELIQFGVYINQTDNKLIQYLRESNHHQYGDHVKLTALSIAIIKQDIDMMMKMFSKANKQYIQQSIHFNYLIFNGSTSYWTPRGNTVYHILAQNEFDKKQQISTDFLSNLNTIDIDSNNSNKFYFHLLTENEILEIGMIPIQISKTMRDFALNDMIMSSNDLMRKTGDMNKNFGSKSNICIYDNNENNKHLDGIRFFWSNFYDLGVVGIQLKIDDDWRTLYGKETKNKFEIEMKMNEYVTLIKVDENEEKKRVRYIAFHTHLGRYCGTGRDENFQYIFGDKLKTIHISILGDNPNSDNGEEKDCYQYKEDEMDEASNSLNGIQFTWFVNMLQTENNDDNYESDDDNKIQMEMEINIQSKNTNNDNDITHQ